ncbi:hypothetical protein KY339_03785 [Candidatus Woesearchaeota archaeon]|nr:hypothetical protein [Candidatus Woesearchaeota archaeon]
MARKKEKQEIKITTNRKVVKRKGAKSAKKAVKQASYVFDNVPAGSAFFVNDGSKINSMHQLAMALEKMNEETFNFHSNEQKNDFSSWVNDVMGEKKLADRLLKAKGKQEAQIEVLKHIVKKLK